jgi:signal transduction histidine kinase
VHQRPGIWLWIRNHQLWVDIGVAALLTVVNVGGLSYTAYGGVDFRDPDAWSVLLNVACALPLALRRRYPLTVALAVGTSYMALGFLGYSSFGGSIALVLALYTLGAHAAVLPGLAITVAGTASSIAYLYVNRDSLVAVGAAFDAWMVGSQVLVCCGTWVVGRTLRARRRYLAELENRADRLERTAAAELRAALAEERARMARELHDVVAHHVSVMTVQAAAARRLIDRSPDRSGEAMQAVEETGRTALVEMRRIVSALRSADAESGADTSTPGHDVLTPQSGVGDLAPLIARAREAGLEVDLTVVGQPKSLPTGVDLAIFRVVQEALTNTLRHAGPTRAAVLLRYETDGVVVGVTDDGSQRRGGPTGRTVDSDRTGHGLIGMRERVTLNGGTLQTGPRTVGGFEVVAKLPVEEATR